MAPSATTTTVSLVSDHVGLLAVNDGLVFYLTACCRASAKGSGDGVVCRACYQLIDPSLGAGWMADDDEAWARWSAAFTAHLERQNAGNVGNPVVGHLVEMVIAHGKQATA